MQRGGCLEVRLGGSSALLQSSEHCPRRVREGHCPWTPWVRDHEEVSLCQAGACSANTREAGAGRIR